MAVQSTRTHSHTETLLPRLSLAAAAPFLSFLNGPAGRDVQRATVLRCLRAAAPIGRRCPTRIGTKNRYAETPAFRVGRRP